jgi:phenylpropionate dioxygenase-like ring-hydroxylating dioxygenase large terminal subunit
MQANDSADLVHVGPGTVMGEFMRQHWLPALLASELQPDGDPLRLMLLGERLVAFRDSAGRIGVMDHRCPHRCASLFLGRNEDHGLRCSYHGWKFDVQGRCVEMPNVPPEQDFKHKVRARAYRTAERHGLVWVYMGELADGAEPPPLPLIEANLVPPGPAGAEAWCLQRDCNWLQALEGDIDTSHVGFLHLGSLQPDELPPGHPMRPALANRAPRYEVQSTEWGTMYGGWRPGDDGRTSWRVAHFMFPFWTQTPNIRFASRAIARAWVPMDDTHSMLFDLTVGSDDGNPAYNSTRRDGTPLFEPFRHAPKGSGWFDRWRCVDDERNDWGLDRASQRAGRHYTGIANITMQDQAITESMGAITDHGFEHLGPSDRMITLTRRRLLNAARAWRDRRELPAAARQPALYHGARAGSFACDAALPLDEAYRRQLAEAERWGQP